MPTPPIPCWTASVWREFHAGNLTRAARDLGLVNWAERRVWAAWRSLRTSNRYWLTQPEGAVQPPRQPHRGICRRTTMQSAGGGESKLKKEAREGSKAALAAMLGAAKGLPDLLAARRTALEARLLGRAGRV